MKNLIKSILLEQEEIEEVEEDALSNITYETRSSKTSVDDQIDSHVLKFEKRSTVDPDVISDEAESLSESLRNLSLKSLLKEEEEEEPEEAEPKGSENLGGDIEMEVSKPQIDIDSFTKQTIRLISNYQTLLKVPLVIVNRTRNFLNENYGKKHVDEFDEILEKEFGIDLEGIEDSEKFKAPFGLGANPAGSGITGGGGGG